MEPTPEPTASPTLSAELMDRPWNVLYVGIDLNERRRGENQPLNTDALMLVSLSADQSELTLVSLPRDTVDVPLPDGTVYPRKINGLYADQGIEALVGAMETLYGVEIDGHVILDMDDFAALVTAVDGVEVTLDEPLADPIVNLALEPGTHTLDAAQALGYVRTRRRPGLRPDGPPAGGDRRARLAARRSGDGSRPDGAPRRPRLARDRSAPRPAADADRAGQPRGRCGGHEPPDRAAADRVRGRPSATVAATSWSRTSRRSAPRCRRSSASEGALTCSRPAPRTRGQRSTPSGVTT